MHPMTTEMILVESLLTLFLLFFFFFFFKESSLLQFLKDIGVYLQEVSAVKIMCWWLHFPMTLGTWIPVVSKAWLMPQMGVGHAGGPNGE